MEYFQARLLEWRKTYSPDWRHLLLWAVYLFILMGLIYRVFYVLDHNPVDHIWSDPERHWVQGIDTQRNDPMVMTDPVIYQLYIAALSKLTFKNADLIAFYTILLCLFTPWVWYRFFRELQPSRKVALVGGLVMVWLPSWLAIYSYFMQETLMLPLLGLALWMSWRCKRKQTVNAFAVMIFIWAIAGLTRGICIPIAAVVSTWLWLDQTDKLKKAIGGMAILMLVLGPLTIRGYQHMGIFAPHGVGHMNMVYAKSGKKEVKITYHRQGAIWYFGFMSPALLVPPFAPISDWQTRRTGKVFLDITIDDGNRDWKKSFAENELSFSDYFWIAKENLIFLFFAPSWPDSDPGKSLHVVSYWMRWIWAPLALLCLVTIVLQIRRGDRGLQLLLPAVLSTWFVLQGLTPLVVNEGRYRKPFEGLALAQIVLFLGTRRSNTEQNSEGVKQMIDSDTAVDQPVLEHNDINGKDTNDQAEADPAHV